MVAVLLVDDELLVDAVLFDVVADEVADEFEVDELVDVAEDVAPDVAVLVVDDEFEDVVDELDVVEDEFEVLFEVEVDELDVVAVVFWPEVVLAVLVVLEEVVVVEFVEELVGSNSGISEKCGYSPPSTV